MKTENQFEYLAQVLRDHIITTATNNFSIPESDPKKAIGEQFVIVWIYQSGQLTADTYKWSRGRLIAWDGDKWTGVECAEGVYNPLDPDPNHTIISVITKD